ncbi:hypothetical protein TeGR_g11346, partial [Tetraparma gracilis]
MLADILSGSGSLSLAGLEAQLSSITAAQAAPAPASSRGFALEDEPSDDLLSPGAFSLASLSSVSSATSAGVAKPPPLPASSNLSDSTSDAWARSLSAFGALAEDFLAADAGKKNAHLAGEGMVGDLGLDEFEGEEYDAGESMLPAADIPKAPQSKKAPPPGMNIGKAKKKKDKSPKHEPKQAPAPPPAAPPALPPAQPAPVPNPFPPAAPPPAQPAAPAQPPAGAAAPPPGPAWQRGAPGPPQGGVQQMNP